MKYNPHDYQRYAAEFITTHPIAALLLDMGLGKTSITLTAINDLLFDSFEVHKVLVVAPLRVARDTWSAEIEKWEHLKNLRYSVVVGTEQERLNALRTSADVYIINRENIQWLVEESGLIFDFDMAVIDELSSFKNHQSKRFKATEAETYNRADRYARKQRSDGFICRVQTTGYGRAARAVHRTVPKRLFSAGQA